MKHHPARICKSCKSEKDGGEAAPHAPTEWVGYSGQRGWDAKRL